MKLCISNGVIVNPASNTFERGDLWIEEDKIICIKTAKETQGKEPKQASDKDSCEWKFINAEGRWVVPGLIDLHVHFREPGFEYKEDISTGSLAAAAGGVTTVCCMPNTKPVIDNAKVVDYIEEKVEEACGVNVLTIGAITKGQQGKTLSEIDAMNNCNTRSKELLGRGICALSEDGRSVMNSKMMLEAMIEASKHGIPIFSHTEDDSLAGTKIGEELIVARDIMLAKETGCRLHLCHISTKGSIDIIREAKKAGIRVTAETCPHYVAFKKEDRNNDGNKKMNPPLRDEADRVAVMEALKDGTLDAISTDHAPHSKEEKGNGFEKALFGVIGLETSFAASYTYLVRSGMLTPIQLIERMSSTPAHILGLDRGDISVGKVADIAIFNVEDEFCVAEDNFKSKSKNSAFLGEKLYGKLELVIINGKIISL